MSRLSELSRSVKGHRVIVTGAASGMGRATARLFADEGARVAVTDLTDAGVKPVVEEIRAAGLEAEGWALDVSNPERVAAVVDEIAQRFGGLDVLVNNAGVSSGGPIESEEYEDQWERSLTVNLTGEMRMIRAALPYLLKSGHGRIVNVASTEGLGATRFTSPYTAAKHGVVGLTRGLAVELGSQGVTVNCICPGPINTGMTASIPDEHKSRFARRRVPVRRYGEPEEVAHATLSFSLPAASFINGVIMQVDGGMMAQNT
jgi:3-oxoacyl-[acyl-carrier protein] reductase